MQRDCRSEVEDAVLSAYAT